jgi:hypothetical protein
MERLIDTINLAKLTDLEIPDNRWISPGVGSVINNVVNPTGRYQRIIKEPLKSISFELCQATNEDIWAEFKISDFTTGFNYFNFWQGMTKFTAVNLPNQKAMKTVVSINGQVITLYVLEANAQETTGKFRRVRINGLPQNKLLMTDPAAWYDARI